MGKGQQVFVVVLATVFVTLLFIGQAEGREDCKYTAEEGERCSSCAMKCVKDKNLSCQKKTNQKASITICKKVSQDEAEATRAREYYNARDIVQSVAQFVEDIESEW